MVCSTRQSSCYNAKSPFNTDKLFYNPAKDCYICPMGQPMNYIDTSKRKTATGFVQKTRFYQAIYCEEGIQRRKKRCWDVEPVFGNIKRNHGS